MSNPGIRSKDRTAEQAYDQLFPQDGLSIFGGVVLTVFVACALLSVAIVISALCLINKTTIQVKKFIAVTPQQADAIKAQWATNFKGMDPPLRQDERTGQWTAQAIVAAKLGDLSYGPFEGMMTKFSAPMYIITTLLTLFALYWSVRGKPTYVASVQAIMIGIAWLGSAIILGMFYPKAIKVPSGYVDALQQAIQQGNVVTPNLVLKQDDIINRQGALPPAFVTGTVFGSVALLALFGVIVVVARATSYQSKE